MQELKIQKIESKVYDQCVICNKVANQPECLGEERKVGDLYAVSVGDVCGVLCKECLLKLRNMINHTLSTQVKFNPGDRVYHRNLEMYGTFIGYVWEYEDECNVKFEEDGVEQRQVSINWLELVDKI